MVDARPILVGPGDKLSWQEAVATNPDATDLDARVSIAIGNRIDKFTGLATVSHGWIAEWIGRKPKTAEQQEMLPRSNDKYERKPGERSVQDSTLRMKRIGLLEIRSGGGRGKANVYQPLIDGKPKQHGQPWGIAAQNRTASRAVLEETARQRATNHTADSHKPHGWPCTLPKNSLNSSYGAPTNDDLDPGNVRWTAVKARLAKSVDQGSVRSWVTPLRFKRQTEFEVVLIAQGQHACGYLEAHAIGDRIRDAWQAEVPTIRRVIYVTDRDAHTTRMAAE